MAVPTAARRVPLWVWSVVVGLALMLVLTRPGCSRETREAIRVEAERIVITNLTDRTWTNVDVWVNDHYRAQAPELRPEQRFDVPLSSLVAGFGQPFNRQRQEVYGVEVSATGGDGPRVEATWGSGRRR